MQNSTRSSSAALAREAGKPARLGARLRAVALGARHGLGDGAVARQEGLGTLEVVGALVACFSSVRRQKARSLVAAARDRPAAPAG